MKAAEIEAVKESSTQATPLLDVKLSETDLFTAQAQHEPLKKWFLEKNISAKFDYSAVDMRAYFDEAAQMLGNHYALFKDILGKINWAYNKNHSGFNLDLGKMAQKDAQTLHHFCQQLYSHTFFSKYIYKKQTKILHVGLQQSSIIKRFFSGAWLEWFALCNILENIQSNKPNLQFSCARNVQIQFFNKDNYELDVVFLPLGKLPIIIECKSGEFRQDIEKYALLKKRLKLPAENFIILATELEAAQALALRSMYEINFATMENLVAKLNKLL